MKCYALSGKAICSNHDCIVKNKIIDLEVHDYIVMHKKDISFIYHVKCYLDS
jgi:hypothetical protein